MERPADLYDRDREWSDLVAFAVQGGAGTHLGLVRGRRRQGKSFLLRRLAAATGGFYYQAVEEERSQALRSFGAALGRTSPCPAVNWHSGTGKKPCGRSPTCSAMVVRRWSCSTSSRTC